MSSDNHVGDRDDPGRARLILLSATDSFDGRDHLMSAAAYELHVRATGDSAAGDHPGLVPYEYLSSLIGTDLPSPGADVTVLAAELCAAGMWEHAEGGYRVLDVQAIQVCLDRIREVRDKAQQAPTREPEHHLRPDTTRHEPRGVPAGEARPVRMAPFGQQTGQAAAASFRCAACGEIAGVVKVTRAGTTVDMGPPLGPQTCDRDAIVVDYFLGTASKLADAATVDAVQQIITSDAPDPAALRRIDWELAPFYCPQCALNYCQADWDTFPVFDEGFYDCTIGICPSGHRHTVDD